MGLAAPALSHIKLKKKKKKKKKITFESVFRELTKSNQSDQNFLLLSKDHHLEWLSWGKEGLVVLAVGEGRGHIYISSVSSLSFQLPIAIDKRGYPHNIFFISLQKTYVVGTH